MGIDTSISLDLVAEIEKRMQQAQGICRVSGRACSGEGENEMLLLEAMWAADDLLGGALDLISNNEKALDLILNAKVLPDESLENKK